MDGNGGFSGIGSPSLDLSNWVGYPDFSPHFTSSVCSIPRGFEPIISCHIVSCRVMSCHIVSCNVISSYIISSHLISSHDHFF